MSRASSPWPVAGWVESRGREGGVGTPLPASGPAERPCPLLAGRKLPRGARCIPNRPHLPVEPQSARFRQFRPLRRSRARFPFLSPTVTSSPGAGEVFPQGGSQAVKFITKVLGAMRKFLAVLLPLPLGEVASRSDDGEGARRSPHCKTLGAMRNLPGAPKTSPFRGRWICEAKTERVQPSSTIRS